MDEESLRRIRRIRDENRAPLSGQTQQRILPRFQRRTLACPRAEVASLMI
jgi:hypothetical protein